MTQWVRFYHEGMAGFGTLEGEAISVCTGNIFGVATPSGQTVAVSDVELDIPCVPTKFIALWNNSRSAAEKQGLEEPAEPLYFIKAANSYLPSGGVIRQPSSYDGRVIYEAELGVVIGRVCQGADVAAAEAAIFGYTCVNDVTALQLLDEDPTFPQWARAKGFDTFGAFGPHIVTPDAVDLASATIRAELNGRERQNYPISDLFMGPVQLVSRLSDFMTLYPGDIISCGTGPGALPMRAGAQIDVIIDGVGRLQNTFEG